MKRQLVLDTETTGLFPKEGARIIEIGCVELVDLKKTGDTYRVLINPEMSIPQVTIDIHHITDDMVKDAPKFKQITDEFLEYIRGSELIIHNSKFDIEMLNSELKRLDKGTIWDYVSNVICTLELDKRLFPEERKHKLDNICERLGLDLTERNELGHNAILDCQLLADAFIKINEMFPKDVIEADLEQTNWVRPEVKRYNNIILPEAKLSVQEEQAHAEALTELSNKGKIQPIFTKSSSFKP